MKEFQKMAMMSGIGFFLFTHINTSWARPESIQVWFLAEETHSSAGSLSRNLITSAMKNVSPVTEPNEKILSPNSTVEDHLGYCDKNYFFDFYCGDLGKGKQEKNIPPVPLEIWIDVSSSFLIVDPLKGEDCFRSKFVEELLKSCDDQKMKILTFDTQFNALKSPQEACMTKGLNDTKKMIAWIEKSEAKSLVFITDLSEYNVEFADYLNSFGAKLVGTESSDLRKAQSLSILVSSLKKSCSL